MRETFFDYPTRGILNLVLLNMNDGRGDRYWLARINTPAKHRGKGIAGRLMREMCSEADAEGVDIYLGISPSGDLDLYELRAWYERLGFVQDPLYPDCLEAMYRPAKQGGNDEPEGQASAPSASIARAVATCGSEAGA